MGISAMVVRHPLLSEQLEHGTSAGTVKGQPL